MAKKLHEVKSNGNSSKQNKEIQEVLKESKKELTNEDKLRLENFQLKQMVVQLQKRNSVLSDKLGNIELFQERARLVNEGLINEASPNKPS